MRVGGDDGELRPCYYIYVYSIECRLIISYGIAYHRVYGVFTSWLSRNAFEVRYVVNTDRWKSGDTTPCRMTGVTLHSHVRYMEIYLQRPGKEILGYPEKGIQTPMAQGQSTERISTIKWIRICRLSIKNSLSIPRGRHLGLQVRGVRLELLGMLPHLALRLAHRSHPLAQPHQRHLRAPHVFIPHNVSTKWLWKVKSSTKSSTRLFK